MAAHDDDERKTTRDEFRRAVNMTPKQMDEWLDTERSKEVGWGEGETVGHKAGRRIVEIKHKKQDDLTDDDYAHMKKVIGYVHRHMAQQPSGDITDTRWRYSLMNWGHDPKE